MSDKQAVLEAINRLPDNATLPQINEEIATLEAIRRGVRAAAEGRVKSHEEVKRLVVEWTSK
jgi:predicted transcriptional regulator